MINTGQRSKAGMFSVINIYQEVVDDACQCVGFYGATSTETDLWESCVNQFYKKAVTLRGGIIRFSHRHTNTYLLSCTL